MKLKDKILYMSFGAGLVVLGMILNSFLVDDADAQVGVQDATFRYITCESISIKDGNKERGAFGVSRNGNAMLEMYGDDGNTPVAYLGENLDKNGEMSFYLSSKSKTDKREVRMMIDENGGRFDAINKMGENVVRLAVGSSGGGGLDMRDKHGYTR